MPKFKPPNVEEEKAGVVLLMPEVGEEVGAKADAENEPEVGEEVGAKDDAREKPLGLKQA